MITKVGFLPDDIEIQNLKKYVVTDSDAESLRESFCKSTNVLYEASSSDYEDEKIFKEDIVLYSTVYDFQMESSFLEFHVYSPDSSLFLHHDICVFSDIYDACNFKFKGENFIALALESNKIDCYSFLIRNPLQPVMSLNKHVSTVSGVAYANDDLFSCSYDTNVYCWDIERQEAKIGRCFNERLDAIDSNNSELFLISLSNGHILDYNLDITAVLNVKNLTGMKMSGDRILLSDNLGHLIERDRRNIHSNVRIKKVHSLGINDFDMNSYKILTASEDETMCVLDTNFDVISSIKTKNKVFSVSIHPKSNFADLSFAYGGYDGTVRLKSLL